MVQFRLNILTRKKLSANVVDIEEAGEIFTQAMHSGLCFRNMTGTTRTLVRLMT
jgi:hypothetical protein